MNTITVAGRVGRSSELRDAGNTKVANFSVATDVGWGDKKQTLWFGCALFGKRAESISQYINKGDNITVSGELSTRDWEGKTQLEINVNDVQLQGSQGGQSQQQEQPTPPPVSDDVPF